MRPTLIATLACFTLIAGTVPAADLVGVPDPAPAGTPSAERPKNGEHHPGKPSEEQKAAIEKRIAEMKEKNPELFKKIDTDGDGRISPEEMRHFHEQHKGGDGKPGEGKPTEEQKAAFRARIEKLKGTNPELFKKIDKDGDGVISPEELRRAHEFMMKHRKGGEGEGHQPGGEGKPPGPGPGPGPNVEPKALNL